MNDVLRQEKKLYFKNTKQYLISLITHEHNYLIWKYIVYLRKEEYSKNKVLTYYYRRRKNQIGSKLGILIYAGTCGQGLHIWHYGSVIVNGYAKIGKNCTLHGQNCIGNSGHDNAAPVIGDNVDIGAGASVIGDIRIADNVTIGAGAVVNKSCLESNVVLAGVPAKIVKYSGGAVIIITFALEKTIKYSQDQ